MSNLNAKSMGSPGGKSASGSIGLNRQLDNNSGISIARNFGYNCRKVNNTVDDKMYNSSTGHGVGDLNSKNVITHCPRANQVSDNMACATNLGSNFVNLDSVNTGLVYDHSSVNNVSNVNNESVVSPRVCKSCGPVKCPFDSTNGSTSSDYGFIPLQPLCRLFDNGSNHGLSMGYLGMHQLLCEFDTPNCISHQLRIPTDLNIPLWDSILNGHRDHQLIIFLKYGFPLDFSQSLEFEPQTVIANHSSTIQHPACIQNYLNV